jgi:hypothetical protein
MSRKNIRHATVQRKQTTPNDKTIPRHLFLMMFHFDFPSYLQKPLVSNQNENPG